MGHGLLQPRFFFVCGHSRSGTTWVEKVLDTHPRVCCTGEFHFELLQRGFEDFTNRPWHLAHREPIRSVAEACRRETITRCLLASAARKPHASLVGDRTPRPLVPLLAGCPHILMVRDGRDVAVSYTIHQIKTNGLDLQQERFRTRLQDDMTALASNPSHFDENPERLFRDELWTRHVLTKWANRCRADLASLDKFASGEYSGSALMCRYEDLHARPESERARLFRFLDVDPAEALPLSRDDGTAPGLARQNPVGKNRRGETGDWKRFAVGPSGEQFRAIARDVARDVLTTLGYETESLE